MYHVNQNFFEVWSPDMAYILGFIYADGCVYNNGRGYSLVIDQKDRQTLETINAVLSSNCKISKSCNWDGYRLDIYSNKVASDLIKLGVTPRKSLTLTFPDVPDDCLRDFVRGYFDGDGGVYHTKGMYTGSLVIKFYSGSCNFLVKMADVLDERAGVASSVHQGDTCYYLQILGGCDGYACFYNFMYSGVEDLYIERKQLVFMDYFQKVLAE